MKNNRKNQQSAKRSRDQGKPSAPKVTTSEVQAQPANERSSVDAVPSLVEAIAPEVSSPAAGHDAVPATVPSVAITAAAPAEVAKETLPAEAAPLVPAVEAASAGLSVVPPAGVVDASVKPVVAPPASKRTQAEQIVRDYVPLAVGAGLLPVPGADLAAIGGLQLKVLAALAELYGVPFTRAQAQLIVTSLLGSVGTTVLAGTVLLSVAKVIPGFGSLLGAASLPVAGGAITHAIGHLVTDHFEAGGTMETFDLDVAQRAFAQKFEAAKAKVA